MAEIKDYIIAGLLMNIAGAPIILGIFLGNIWAEIVALIILNIFFIILMRALQDVVGENKSNVVTPSNKMWREAMKNLVDEGILTPEQYNRSVRKLEKSAVKRL